MDHTFKIAAAIMDSTGSRAFAANFNVMNELGQFVAIAFAKDTRIGSLRNLFAMRTDARRRASVHWLQPLLSRRQRDPEVPRKGQDRSRWRRRRHHPNPSRWLARRDGAVTRATSKVTNKKNPLTANFSREFWIAAEQFKTEQAESLARCLEQEGSLWKETALVRRAWKRPHGHAAHFHAAYS